MLTRDARAARRVTYHPDLDVPVNWTRDGQRILILSFRHRTSLLGGRLYTVPVQSGIATEVPVPRGWRGSFSPLAIASHILEKAVELAMDVLKKTKTPASKRPGYPVYK